jgi:hypothetical protein
VNEAVVAPCGTVTEAGTDAADFELESAIVNPPFGAGAAMVTVPCAVCPLRIDVGLTDRLVGRIGFTVKPVLTLTPLREAVSTAVVVAVTVPADAVNEAVVAPCATVTEAGNDTDGLELESATVMPPVGAGAAIVTVPCAVCPLRIVVGVRVRPTGRIGFTVKLALRLVPPSEAVRTAVVIEVTVPAVAVKEAVVAPCSTVTEAGTDTAWFELESAIVTPPAGAGAEMVTVPCVVCPLTMEFELSEKAIGTIGFTVKLALTLTPPPDAVRTTAVIEVTVPAVAVKVALFAPCGTVTDAGTETDALELESAIAMPPAGAGAEMVTVP